MYQWLLNSRVINNLVKKLQCTQIYTKKCFWLWVPPCKFYESRAWGTAENKWKMCLIQEQAQRGWREVKPARKIRGRRKGSLGMISLESRERIVSVVQNLGGDEGIFTNYVCWRWAMIYNFVGFINWRLNYITKLYKS